jgi:polyisoprenoid-binding protein YceI
MRTLIYLAALTAASAQDKTIDVEHSTITVHVGKTGVFSGAGHEHWVNAPLSAGTLNDADSLHIEFKVDAAKMEVKPDPKIDAATQARIQRDMQEMTLESRKYSQITFRSSRVEKQADGLWEVEGMLTRGDETCRRNRSAEWRDLRDQGEYQANRFSNQTRQRGRRAG